MLDANSQAVLAQGFDSNISLRELLASQRAQQRFRWYEAWCWVHIPLAQDESPQKENHTAMPIIAGEGASTHAN